MSNQDRLPKSLSTAKIKFKLRCGNSRLGHSRASDSRWPASRGSGANLIKNRRDAMTPDDDVEMVDADLPRFSTVEKGKGKAAEPALPEEDNSLPWCVPRSRIL